MENSMDEWDREITLNHKGNLADKVSFVQNLYDKTAEKINHFDKLRQQHINFALLAFAGLLGFIVNADVQNIRYVGCLGIAVLMLVFLSIDYRLHKYTHGFSSALLRFAEAQAKLLNESDEEVKLFQYVRASEKKARSLKSLHYWIYFLLILTSGILALLNYSGKMEP
jgi:hypothetical protein